ncbi:hypothetical protein DFP72DRAFT_953622 [Ephemerocybe angulata]|uniref:Uncharacterized protein n=1 Tax=Ephemerocybe angulata TaxID=980116 RepID=A0A8H6MF76_9AGAR|nr:hypothetical protein DFP72DRAFT_953622 [Tulosesus angulatus]
MSSPAINLQSILRLPLTSPEIASTLRAVNNGEPVPDPDIKSYSDSVYFNYYSLGLSLLYAPQQGYKPKQNLKFEELELEKLVLDSIDVYNVPPAKDSDKKSGKSAFATYPALPLVVELANLKDGDNDPIVRAPSISITATTTGKDLVSTLGEPDKKGGGAGPSNGSIDIWTEWYKDGVMVEFGGDEARGPQAWERGKDAAWRVLTLYKTFPLGLPTEGAGSSESD